MAGAQKNEDADATKNSASQPFPSLSRGFRPNTSSQKNEMGAGQIKCPVVMADSFDESPQPSREKARRPVVLKDEDLIPPTEASFRDRLNEVLACFTDHQAWLNDTSIDMYMQMIVSKHSRNNIRCLTTHFFSVFMGNTYGSIMSWIDRLGVIFHSTTVDVKLLMPVHINGDHWVLAFIDFKNKHYSYYDSFQHSRPIIKENLRRLLKDAHQHQDPEGNFSLNEWTTDRNGMKGPRQTNSIDCGVFLCLAARHLLLNDNLSIAAFTQQSIPQCRNQIAEEIENWWFLIHQINPQF
jgi:hypothetical protein